MSGKRWFDKKTAKTYKVVHRAHEDPLYHDDSAGGAVLVEVDHPKNRKIKTKAQLEAELGEEVEQIRLNEGEAAVYGITYDDSKYDYMQHLKPIGNDDGVFIAKNPEEQKKNKNKGIQFHDFTLPQELKGSDVNVKRTYQDQQNIPDEIAGFQPDLNPALREVLEALEDEAYVDEDEDVFENLLGSGEQIDDEEFEDQFDEWDLDNYENEMANFDKKDFAEQGDQGWEADFRKFKAVSKHKKNEWDSDDEFGEDEGQDVLPELPSFKDAPSTAKKGSKRKQRMKKGAMTDTTSFSMTSSALYRSEGLTILDDRFEKVMNDYQENEEEEYKPFDMSKERTDFEDLLDDFLDNYEIEGGRRIVKKSEELNNLKIAADSASKGKLAQRRRKQGGLDGLSKGFGGMKI
jgi:protein LTV1